ncbi:MAG TPA: DUF4384 domain-containing protein [Gemmatimonadaceae bacterium]
MFSAALISLLLSAASGVPTSPAARQASDPPVRVSLDHKRYDRGDRARVTVRARDDGYLLVLHLDPDGRLRVLFPLDPGDDDFVRGGETYEIRGRGDREAFTVEAPSGGGTVYAAWSADPFRFDDFVLGDHWDYRVLGDSALPSDPEVGLTNLVQRMSAGHFEYDLTSYDVRREVAYAEPAYYATPVVYSPFAYDACYGAFYDPWCERPPIIFYPVHYPFRPYYPGFSISFTLAFGRPLYPYYAYRHHHFYGYGPYAYGAYYDPYYSAPYFFGGCRWSCGWGRVAIVGRHHWPYGYDGASWPYRFKGSTPSGPGIQYRPRGAFAEGLGRPMSPVFVSSRPRGAAHGVGVESGRRREVPRRVPVERPVGHPGSSIGGRGAPSIGRRSPGADGPGRGVRQGGQGEQGGRRGIRSEHDGARRAGPDTPRRMVPLNDGSRYEDGPRYDAPRYDAPRGTEQEMDGRRSPRSEPRAEPKYIVVPPGGPRSEPRADPPRRSEPRSDAPVRVEPRYYPPRQAEPRYTPPPRVEQPRQAPRPEPRYIAPRAEPRREAPPPRVESRPSAPARSAPGRSGGGGGGRRRP